MVRDSKTVKSSLAVFREVHPVKGFINLAGSGNALASEPRCRVVAVRLHFGIGEGHCLSSSISSVVGNRLAAFCKRFSVKLLRCTRRGNLALQ